MTRFQKENYDTTTPEKCVKSALKHIISDKSEFSGHWKHEIIDFYFDTMPKFFLEIFQKRKIQKNYDILNKIRERRRRKK